MSINSITPTKICYITGRGGSLDHGLSPYLATLSDDYQGLAVDSALLSLPIDDQVQRVTDFWLGASGGHLIVNSYGGYLLMLSLIDANQAPERVLMLSPLLGRSLFRESFFASRPPREPVLRKALEGGRVQRSDYLRIVTGGDDEICCPLLAQSVADQLRADQIDILDGQSHSLARESVSRTISAFLAVD